MALLWSCAFLFCLVAVSLVHAEMNLDCRPDYMTLVWTDSRSQADFSLFRLGSCFPTSFTAREVVFNVEFDDCSFRKLRENHEYEFAVAYLHLAFTEVTGDELTFSNDLIYTSSPDSHVLPFALPVVCSYKRPKDWYPMTYDPVFSTYGVEDLVFHLELMNADFSGPAESTEFSLGSLIPIMASVEQETHQPLLVLLEECVAATTPDLLPSSEVYKIITNKGCLVDSKTSRSRFERQNVNDLKLSLQAFRFALGQEVYIHCSILAWDPNRLDETKKACHYVADHGWELLDNPVYSGLCDCCESTCKSRKKRSLGSDKTGLIKKAVLGPLTITE